MLLDCNTELKNGSMTALNTHILKTSKGSWRLQNTDYDFTIDVYAIKHFPATRRQCVKCYFYLNMQLLTTESLSGNNHVQGLCGRYFKGGVEADKWYFGTKCLTQNPLRRFTAYEMVYGHHKLKTCVPQQAFPCAILGNLHVKTFLGTVYQLIRPNSEKEFLVSRGADVIKVIVGDSEILHQKDEEAVINGVQGLAIKTKENETLTITSDLDSLLVKLDCGKNIEADMVTKGGMKVEWTEQSLVKVETQSNTWVIVQKTPAMLLNVYLLQMSTTHTDGICGQTNLETQYNQEYFAKLSVNKDMENSRFDLALLDSHTKREKFFCDNVQKLFGNEEIDSDAKSGVTEEAICQLLGPGFVTAFSGFKYFTRHAGNFLAFQHHSIPEAIFVQTKVLEKNVDFLDVKGVNGDSEATPDTIGITSFAIKYLANNVDKPYRYVTVSIDNKGNLLYKEDCDNKKETVLLREKAFKPADSIQMDTTFDVDGNTLTVALQICTLGYFLRKKGTCHPLRLPRKYQKMEKRKVYVGNIVNSVHLTMKFHLVPHIHWYRQNKF